MGHYPSSVKELIMAQAEDAEEIQTAESPEQRTAEIELTWPAPLISTTSNLKPRTSNLEEPLYLRQTLRTFGKFLSPGLENIELDPA